MSGYFAARDVQPIDFAGSFLKGVDAGQRGRENQHRLEGLQAQSDWQKQNLRASELMRAMELGADSPDTWDSAMKTLADDGNEHAGRMVGQWAPLRSQRMLESYKRAYGGARGGAAAPGTDQLAPVDSQRQKLTPDQLDRLREAAASMPVQNRTSTLKNYEHMLRAMDGVSNPADLDAMLEDFTGRKMMPPEVAEQYRMRYAQPESMWKNFRQDFNTISMMRDALAEYAVPEQLGMPVGQQPSYKAEWDAENQLGVVTSTRPGQAPTFNISRPAGIPDGQIAGGKWPEGLKDTVSQEAQFRQQWQSNPRVQAALGLKDATEMLVNLNPETNTGVADVAAVYQFVKALDPTSVVREGEIALLGEAKSLIDRIRGSAERVQKGRTLTPSLLRDMQDAAKRLRDIAHDSYKHQRKMNMDSVKPFAGYVDADRAFPDYWGGGGFVDLPPPPVTGTGSSIGGVPNPGNDIEDVPGRH